MPNNFMTGKEMKSKTWVMVCRKFKIPDSFSMCNVLLRHIPYQCNIMVFGIELCELYYEYTCTWIIYICVCVCIHTHMHKHTHTMDSSVLEGYKISCICQKNTVSFTQGNLAKLCFIAWLRHFMVYHIHNKFHQK